MAGKSFWRRSYSSPKSSPTQESLPQSIELQSPSESFVNSFTNSMNISLGAFPLSPVSGFGDISQTPPRAQPKSCLCTVNKELEDELTKVNQKLTAAEEMERTLKKHMENVGLMTNTFLRKRDTVEYDLEQKKEELTRAQKLIEEIQTDCSNKETIIRTFAYKEKALKDELQTCQNALRAAELLAEKRVSEITAINESLLQKSIEAQKTMALKQKQNDENLKLKNEELLVVEKKLAEAEKEKKKLEQQTLEYQKISNAATAREKLTSQKDQSVQFDLELKLQAAEAEKKKMAQEILESKRITNACSQKIKALESEVKKQIEITLKKEMAEPDSMTPSVQPPLPVNTQRPVIVLSRRNKSTTTPPIVTSSAQTLNIAYATSATEAAPPQNALATVPDTNNNIDPAVKVYYEEIRLLEEMASQTRAAAELKNTVLELKKKIAELQNERTKMASSRDELQKKVTNFENQLLSKEKTLNGMVSKIETVEKEHAKMLKGIRLLEANLQTAKESEEKAKQKLEGVGKLASTKDSRVYELEQQKKDWLAKEKKHKAEINHLQDINKKNRNFAQEVDRLKSIVDTHVKTIEMVKADNEQLKEQNAMRYQKIMEMKTKLSATEASLEVVVGRNADSTIDSALLRRKKELEGLRVDLLKEKNKSDENEKLELLLNAPGINQKEKTIAKTHFQVYTGQIEQNLKIVKENLRKIQDHYEFRVDKLMPIPDIPLPFSHKNMKIIEAQLALLDKKKRIKEEKFGKILDAECPVCLERVDPASEQRFWCDTCKRNSHEHCALNWFDKSFACPACSTPLASHSNA